MTPIDVRPADLDTVRRILREHVPDLEVHAFGSRVAWNARETSDLDLALMTDKPLGIDRTAGLRAAFTDSDLPFRVDIVDWATASEKFRQRILADHVVLRAQTVEIAPLTTGSKAVQVDSARRDGGWRETRLGDVITLKRGYDLPHRQRVDGPVPVVSSSGISDHHSDSRVSGPGVVTGRYGTLGKVFFIPDDFWPLNTALYVQDFKGNDPRFISYFLRSLDFSACSDKAAVPGLNRNHLHEESVRIPASINEQRTIAHVLGTLDDKIELNRRMNVTLDAMARALFQSWFVDFDPVRAKMDGRDAGLPQDIADLFPERLVDSELGEIPAGWRVGRVEDGFEIVMGQSPPGHTYNDIGDGLPFFQGRSDFGFRYPTNRKFCTAPNRIAQPWDTLVSVRAPVGDINMAWERCCIGRGVGALRPSSGAASYGYCAARALQTHMREYEHTGTVFGAINRKQLARLPLTQPAADVVRAFEGIVHPWDQLIRLRTAEVNTLTALRDTLLPRLVSGTLRLRMPKLPFQARRAAP